MDSTGCHSLHLRSGRPLPRMQTGWPFFRILRPKGPGTMCRETGAGPGCFVMIEVNEPRRAAVYGRALAARSSASATTSSNPPQQRLSKSACVNWAFTEYWLSEPDTSDANYEMAALRRLTAQHRV